MLLEQVALGDTYTILLRGEDTRNDENADERLANAFRWPSFLDKKSPLEAVG